MHKTIRKCIWVHIFSNVFIFCNKFIARKQIIYIKRANSYQTRKKSKSALNYKLVPQPTCLYFHQLDKSLNSTCWNNTKMIVEHTKEWAGLKCRNESNNLSLHVRFDSFFFFFTPLYLHARVANFFFILLCSLVVSDRESQNLILVSGHRV